MRKALSIAGEAKSYAYSEARQKLACVLDRAESTGKVLIR
jgi:hypothetical protein